MPCKRVCIMGVPTFRLEKTGRGNVGAIVVVGTGVGTGDRLGADVLGATVTTTLVASRTLNASTASNLCKERCFMC